MSEISNEITDNPDKSMGDVNIKRKIHIRSDKNVQTNRYT